MNRNLTHEFKRYPAQVWLIVTGMMLAWLFHSMMWSYLLLYSSAHLNEQMTTVAWLMTLNALVGFVTTFLGGTIADKFGRKGVLVLSLIMCGVGWFFFRNAGTMPVFALLMALIGASTPLYRLAADSMIADLVQPDDRLNAYSILRMGNNLGVALGPALGGFLAAVSYKLSFTFIGLGFLAVSILAAVLLSETKPKEQLELARTGGESTGYRAIFRDKQFRTLLGAFTLNRICTSILWLLLAAYAKQNYGLSEKIYGFIPATNAVMVILFQLLVTRWVNRRTSLGSMTFGALIYAVAIFSVSQANGFWGFWTCMVFATIGEMVLVPTMTTFTARLAPAEMRARYMGALTLAWSIGTGIGPVLGGFAGDRFGAGATWYAAGLVGLAGTLLFAWLAARQKSPPLASLDKAA